MNKRTLKVRQKLLGFIFMERSFKELCVHKLIRKKRMYRSVYVEKMEW